MGINFAPNSAGFFLFCSLELLYIIIPLIIFKLKELKSHDIKRARNDASDTCIATNLFQIHFKRRIIPQKRSKVKRLLDLFLGIGFGFLFYILSHFLSGWIYNYIISTKGQDYYAAAVEGGVNTTPPEFTSVELTFSIIVMFLFVALSEEYFYRGLLLKEFSNKNKTFGIILSSFIFMLYHVFPGIVPWITFAVFWSYYLVFGLILSLIVIINKGDLIMAIIAHGTFNSILLILQYG